MTLRLGYLLEGACYVIVMSHAVEVERIECANVLCFRGLTFTTL